MHTLCFYDDTLGKEIAGQYKYDGKTIHVTSYVYGATSIYSVLYIALRYSDHNALELFAKQVFSELASDAERDSATSQKDSATSHRLKKGRLSASSSGRTGDTQRAEGPQVRCTRVSGSTFKIKSPTASRGALTGPVGLRILISRSDSNCAAVPITEASTPVGVAAPDEDHSPRH